MRSPDVMLRVKLSTSNHHKDLECSTKVKMLAENTHVQIELRQCQ